MSSGLSRVGAFDPSTMRSVPRWDAHLVASAALLVAIGLYAVYSVDIARPNLNLFGRQAFMAAVGIVGFVIASRVSPEKWKLAGPYLYIANICLLLLVLLFGQSVGGAQRWLEFGPIQFQPSELSKVLMIGSLASFFANRRESIRSPSTFFLSLLYVVPIMLLIVRQPHLGGALAVGVIWLAIAIYAGVPWRFLILLLLGSLAIGVAAIKFEVLRPYQLERVEGLFNPDERDNAYQQTRAKLAISLGGFSGVGFLQGDQKEAGFIPEQQTDFIFTVIGEEGGFIGSFLVLIAYAFFLYRVWLVGFRTGDYTGRLIAGGVLGVLGFHTAVNLAMNLGLAPVVGLWLPFLSYGGTALVATMTMVGMLMKVR